MHILENATRDFWPPDKLATVWSARSPDTPKLPSCLLYSSVGLPEIICLNYFLDKNNPQNGFDVIRLDY